MDDVNWVTRDGVDWVVVPSRPGQDTRVEVFIDVGLADETAADLGTLQLVAVWLGTELGRLPVRVEAIAGLTSLTLRFTGAAGGVVEGLRRLDDLVGDAAIDVTDSLRESAGRINHPLEGWERHAAVQVGVVPLGLGRLAPLSLATLEQDAVRGFVARRLTRAGKTADGSSGARWGLLTNDPCVVSAAGLVGRPVIIASSPAVAGSHPRPGPACLPQQNPEQLLSVAVPGGSAAAVALTVIAETLRARLMRVQPLVSRVDVRLHPLRLATGLAVANVVTPDPRAHEVAPATAEVLTNLADRIDDAALDRGRHTWAGTWTSDGSSATAVGRVAVRHWLAGGQRLLPTQARDGILSLDDDEVRAALAAQTATVLLAVPAADLDRAPFPRLTAGRPHPVEGRRFRSRLPGEPDVRIGSDRIANVQRLRGRGGAEAVVASMAFADVAARVNFDDTAVTLVDRHLDTVSIRWPIVSGTTRLRALLDRALPDVPVINAIATAEARQEVAEALEGHQRRQVRRRVAGAVATICLAPLVAVVAQALAQPDHPPRDTIPWAQPLRLSGGTTLELSPAPEVRPASATTLERLLIGVRMCAGAADPDAPNDPHRWLDPGDFTLLAPDGSTIPRSLAASPDRPPLPAGHIASGRCRSGWLAFPRPAGQPADGYVLRWTNRAGDRATWDLPPLPGTAEHPILP